MQQSEYPHNTPEQVARYLDSAVVLVERLDVPEDLRAVAFSKAVDLFSSKQIIYEQPAALQGLPALRPQ